MFFKKNKNNKDRTYIGGGYDLVKNDKEDIQNIYITDAERAGHIFGMGTTRIGKTRLMENMITQDIQKGYSVVLIDPKGDNDIFSKICQTAFEEDRLEDLFYTSIINANKSTKFNPLAYYLIPDEIVYHTTSGIVTEEQFYLNVAYETTLVLTNALILIRKAENNSQNITFKDIKYYASQDDLKKLLNLLENISFNNKEDKTIQEDNVHLLKQLVSSPSDYFAKVSSTLRTTLTMLTNGRLGQVIATVNDNPIIERLESGKRIIFTLQTDALLTRTPSALLSRLTISMFQSFVGRMFASGEKINPPLCLYIDEASNVLYNGIENMFNKAGGAGLWITAFTQSVSDIIAEIGQDRTKKILDNTNTKLYMRVNDSDTAKFISLASGIKKGYSQIMGLGGMFNLKQEELELVNTDTIMNMGKREFLFFGPDGRFHGMTAKIQNAYLRISNEAA